MDLSRLVRTQITTGELLAPTELVEGAHSACIGSQGSSRTAINAGSTPLSDLVKALGEYLVSQEDETRLKGGSISGGTRE